jgi:nucleotidyltransferase/DNA polymerase involved in DNA repair
MWGGSSKNYPKAIIHVDGDSFFVACEVAKDPSLRGKFVVTGKERGIASALSYEAKARGAKRGMPLSEIRKLCPGLIILPSDYETYSLYSERMYNILKRFTPEVDEYSIDECFADLTGLRRALHMSYEDTAEKIKNTLDNELGITFSVGLSVNKVLAKVASKWGKPSGLTFIPADKIGEFLRDLPAHKIWGIGPNTAQALARHGIKTALDFADKPESWVMENFDKPIQEIYYELRGKFVLPLTIGHKESYASISKTKTFTPPSMDERLIFSQLSKNIENAFIKLRRHSLFTKRIYFFIKTNEFKYRGLELDLSTATSVPEEAVNLVREYFHQVYQPNVLYRATGIVLSNICEQNLTTLDLFGRSEQIERVTQIYKQVDYLSHKYGKHSVFLGSSLTAMNHAQHQGQRGAPSERRNHLFKGETSRRRIGLPYMGVVK